MNRRRLLMIGGLALAVGLLVSYTVYNRLRTFAGASNNEPGAAVVIAANDIQVGAKLESHDVRVVTLPQSAVSPGAFSGPSPALGPGAIFPVTQGGFILLSKLAARTTRSPPAAPVPTRVC